VHGILDGSANLPGKFIGSGKYTFFYAVPRTSGTAFADLTVKTAAIRSYPVQNLGNLYRPPLEALRMKYGILTAFLF
jgi:hypothetical protein